MRDRGAVAAVCVSAVLSVGALTSCGSDVSGVAQPAQRASGGSSDTELSKLLLEPSEFPGGFDTVVLPPQAVSMAAPDLTGVPQNAKVEPARCVPPEQEYGPTSTAMAVGTNNATRATITVELTRAQATIGELKDQAEDCSSFTVTSSGAKSTVTTDIVPPPPVDADDTLALRRTVASGESGGEVVQSMTTLMGEVGDVRISATLMSFGSGKPELAPLDEAFTAAVQKVKQS
ncbi:DUF5642 family protein [Rhodococcus sp. NPDC058521]|uniref:DUF5642 family protein n=1 Tax=Rhodococcus sp. NPDC058521 TaxID=3346536 RepID=UPI003664F720